MRALTYDPFPIKMYARNHVCFELQHRVHRCVACFGTGMQCGTPLRQRSSSTCRWWLWLWRRCVSSISSASSSLLALVRCHAHSLAWLASDEPLLCSLSTRSVYYSRYVGRSLRVRGLLIFSIVTLAYGYAGVLGWPPFLHARLGSSLPWSRNASPQHQVGACGLPCWLCVGRAKCGPRAVTNQRCVLACGSTWLASARMWLGGNSSPDTWPSCLRLSRRTSSGGSSA